MGQVEPVRLGLYYPFIQFRNDSWLKLAALYWDRIGRIVPPGYELQDSDTVLRLKGELEFVRDLAPSDAQLDSVGSEFLKLLAEHGPQLADLYGMKGRIVAEPEPAGQSWPPPWGNVLPWQRTLGAPPLDPSLVHGADPRLAYIYASGKMTAQLKGALLDVGLGVPVPAHGLIGMHPQLALVYMHALASKMATSVMCPLTDDDFYHVAAGYDAGRIADALLDIRADELAGGDDEEGPAVDFAMLALQSVVPKDIGSLPVQKIIEIRQRHRDELLEFRQAAQEITNSIPEAVASADRDVGAMYLQSLYENTLELKLQQLKSSLHRSGVDSVLGSMSIKVEAPQLVTSGSALFGIGALHLNPVLMGAGAIVMCLIPRIRRQRAKAQRLRAESPAAYLLRIEEELTPSSLASDMTAKARRLMMA